MVCLEGGYLCSASSTVREVGTSRAHFGRAGSESLLQKGVGWRVQGGTGQIVTTSDDLAPK